MGLLMKETIKMVTSMVTESSNGQMVLSMKVSLEIIILKALENMFGQIRELIKVNGSIIKCMEKEVYLLGRTEDSTKEAM